MKKLIVILAVIALGFTNLLNAQNISTIAGSGSTGYSGDGGPSITASFYRPVCAIKDGAGNLYVSDFYNYRVRKISTSCVISTIAGNGAASSSGDGGPATAASINCPHGLAFDGAGNLYIADAVGNRIRKIDGSGTITTIAGTGAMGYGGDGGPATAAILHTPEGLSLDAAGNVYFADIWNFRIRKISTSGNITTVAGDGSGTYSGDGGPATAAGIHLPVGVTVDNTGNIYIAEVGSSAIRKVNTSGVISTIAGTGVSGFSGDGGAATAAQISGPEQVAFDMSGNLLITDRGNNCIRKINGSGIISTIAGTPTASGFSGDGGAATSAKFNSLSYTFPDSSGNLYIADVNNDRIRVISVPISAISGLSTVCVGSTITFTDATSGGIWSSANTSIATVGSSSGIVNGLSAGVDTIYYTTIGGTASTTITVNPLPAPITGYFSICSVVGGTTTLSDATPGGTWSSSNPTIATIGSATGIANAVGSGPGTTTTITYTLPTGCVATTTLNVVPPPSPIFFGPNNVCAGACITMTPTVGGGTWSSTSGTVANVGSSTGVVCGLSSGTTVISYCCTCPWGKTVTVNPNPAPIAGPNTVCTGATIALSDLTPGGTWSASNGHATVGSLSGIVTGVTAGIDTISYSQSSGCSATKIITVNAAPSAISGTPSLCNGNCVTFTNAVPGGSWSSSSPSIATVGSGTGLVCGAALGNATISYSLSNGCFSLFRATVNSIPASFTVTGGGSYCAGGGGLHIGLSGSSLGVNYQLMLGASTVGAPLPGTGGPLDFGLISAAGTYTVTATNATTGCTRAMAGSATININALPTAIAGPSGYCIGGTGSLSSSPSGGTWSVSSPAAAVGSSSGLVTGLSVGTASITYTSAAGCVVSTLITVNPSVGTTSGPSSVCAGATITLSNSTPGGVWASSAPSVAGVGSLTGVITGVAVGTSVITYSLGGTCTSTFTVNVTSGLSPITGPSNACIGSTVSLSDAMPGGVWASSNPSVATVSGTGVVTGVAIGVTTISYTISGCSATINISVNASPSPISGLSSVCVGSNITMSNSVSGGLWSSTSSTVSVGSATGIVTGMVAGPALITYSIGTCVATTTITVNPSAPIAGTFAVCVGGTTVLTDAATGGSWSSTNTSVATIVAGTGLLTAVSPGASVITYSLPSGCIAIATVSINAAPGPISGPSTLCDGTSVTLSNATPGGTWSSGTTSVLTIGSTTGIITTSGPGTSTVTYDVGGCFSTYAVTVTPAPAVIGGPSAVCVGLTATLTNSVAGGVWSSSDNAVAYIGSSSGIVTGVATGTVIILYTLGTTGCTAIAALVVNPVAPVIGTPSVCVGQTTNLGDTVLGGTWSSSNPSVGTISSAGVVTGIAPGITTITYTLPTGCTATLPVSVFAVPAAVTGTTHVCMGQFTTLHDATPGGAWSSSDPSVAAVSGTGDVTGVTAGIAIISYTVSTGCSSVAAFTVNPAPPAISGSPTVCLGTCDILSDALTGGTWASSSSTIVSIGSSSGVVCGLSTGTAVITYHAPITGCSAIQAVTVLPLPSSVTGPPSLCVGSSVFFSDPAPGGVWSTSNPTIASVGSATGFVTGNSSGTVTVSYTVSSGCAAVRVITVNPLPPAITGTTNICIGLTSRLSDAVPGGFWTSSDLSVATVGVTSGIVTGVAAGTAMITYTIPTGCAATVAVHIGSGLAPIAGIPSVCVGTSSALADASPGGSWSSSAPGIATVSSTGVLTGVALGTSIISYSDGSPCPAVLAVSVNPAPLPIAGSSNICIGTTTILTDPVPGGTWTSSNTAAATINPLSGALVGVAAGSTTITYSMGAGCEALLSVTVQLLPSPITGPDTLCAAQVITLTDATFGGTWSTGSPSVAAVGSLTGIVTGLSSGVAVIYYSNGVGCSASYSVTVLPTPAAITGSANMCLGGSTTLFNSVSGGVWSSADPAVAAIGSLTGIVTSVAPGYATIIYQILPGGCAASTTVNVLPLPTAFAVTGGGSYCASDTGVHIGLSNSETGVNYTLLHGATAIGSLPGTGAALDYGLLTSPGTYTIKGTNTTTTCQNTMTGSATVIVIPNVTPSVLVSPNPNDTVCTGAAVLFSPTPTNGGPAPVYQWFVNGVLIGTYSTYSYIPANGDIVKVLMTSNATCVLPATASDSLTMTVMPYGTPVVTTYSNPGDTVCLGSSVTVHSVPVYGGTAPVYFWILNGTNVGSAPTYTFVPTNGDQIYCVMYSSYPCRLANRDTSDIVTMSVDTPAAPVVTIIALPGSTVGHGQEDTLTASATGAVAPTYQWYINGAPVPGATDSTYISSSFGYPAPDSVSCEVTSHGPCVTSGHSWLYITVTTEGISQLIKADDIRITPNPCSGDITITSSCSWATGNGVSVEITSMLGRTVYSSIAQPKNGKLNELIHLDESVANGVYLLAIRSGSESKIFHLAVTR